MIGNGLYLVLSADPGVTAQLGTSRADGTNGIFPGLAPDQPSVPYVVYEKVGAEAIISMQGANKTQYVRMRYKCYGAAYGDADQLMWAIKYVLNGFVGPLGDSDNTYVQSCFMLHEDDIAPEDLLHGTLYGTVIDFEIVFVDNKVGV
jgi:hypothetical protein